MILIIVSYLIKQESYDTIEAQRGYWALPPSIDGSQHKDWFIYHAFGKQN